MPGETNGHSECVVPLLQGLESTRKGKGSLAEGVTAKTNVFTVSNQARDDRVMRCKRVGSLLTACRNLFSYSQMGTYKG